MAEKSYVGGKIGDVSGKIGDVSGLGVGGKIGDVSGDATFEEIQGLLLQDRRAGSIECLEARVTRLEYDILAIARWLDMRMRMLENRVQVALEDFGEDIADHEARITNLEEPEEEKEYRKPRTAPK